MPRYTCSLAILDAAVREGVVTQESLGSVSAGRLQRVNQLCLDGGGDLLVPPASSIVLADVEPDQTSTSNIIPAHSSIVGSTVSSHLSSILCCTLLLLSLGDVDHEALLVQSHLGGQLVHGLAGVVATVLC